MKQLNRLGLNKTPEINQLKGIVNHSHPGIGPFSTETIKAYQEAGLLNSMFTTLVFHQQNVAVKYLLKVFPFLKTKLKNRYFEGIPLKKIKLYPLKELFRLFAVKFLSLTTADLVWEWAELGFDRWVANHVNNDVKMVHCYEHAALFTFKKAHQVGCFKILEQVSQHHSHYTQLAEQQFNLYPNLHSKYNETIALKNIEKRNRRKDSEYELADLIICNSTFTMKTLTDAGIEKEKILKIPLAYPQVFESREKTSVTSALTFIYVGSLSLRKGTHILLEVWKKQFAEIPEAKLILAGSNSLPLNFMDDLPSNVALKGFLNKTDLDEIYNQADVLVFPTLADGFGMVITEAMAKGIPVLTTNNSAGYDLIEDGVDGFLIEAGNADALAEKMVWINNNRHVLPEMGKLALEKAKKYQWADYRALLISSINKRYTNYLNG